VSLEKEMNFLSIRYKFYKDPISCSFYIKLLTDKSRVKRCR